MSLFRPQAVEAKRRKLWGDVRLAQPPSLMVWTVVLTVICLGLVAVLVTGRYTRKETVSGYLDTEAGTVDVRPLQAGRVARVLVRLGTDVKVGDPLIEFVSDVEGIQGGPAIDVQLADADRQLQALTQRRSAVEESYNGELQRLQQQVQSQKALIAITAEQQRGQADAIKLAEADLARLERLQGQGFAPGSEVDRRRRALLAEQAAMRQLDTIVAAAEARVVDLLSQIAAAPARQAETDAILNGEGARLGQQKSQLSVARGYILRAPVAGSVIRLQAREGFSPPGNGALLTIAPQGSMMFARVLVPTRSIGFLSVGREANLQIDAFPFQRFGMIKGYISEIHPMVIRPGEAGFPVEQTEPSYEVDLFITREHVVAYGERRALRPGMTVRADLPIDRRRLWQQLFDPLLAAGARFN